MGNVSVCSLGAAITSQSTIIPHAASVAGGAAAGAFVGRLVSTRLIYYEQGGPYLQPAYLFSVVLTGPLGTRAGLTETRKAIQALRASPLDFYDVYRETFDYLHAHEPMGMLPLAMHCHWGGRPLMAATRSR